MKALTVWQPCLAGVLHGDGWCTELSLGLRCKDGDFSEAFATGVNTLFGTALLPRRDERNYWLVRAGNKSGKFSTLKSYEPRDNDEVSSWLRGLFDSEGNAQFSVSSRGENSFYRRVAIYSTARGTIDRAAEFLDWLDVPHSIRATKNSSSHLGSKTVFELRMTRQDGFRRFLEMVGSNIERKHDALVKIVSSYQDEGWQARNWQKAVAARWPKR